MSARLILMAGYRGPYEGSFIPMARSLARCATERGWSAELAFLDSARRHEWFEALRAEDVAEVVTVPAGGRRASADWLAQRTREPGPLVLHTHFTDFDLPAASVRRRRPGTAVLWHVHTPLNWTLGTTPRNLVKFGVIGRGVDAILASGPDPERGILRAGAPRRIVEVVGGGVDTGRFPPITPDERERARAALGVPGDAAVLLHFAWDWELKDGDLFLEAVRELGRERPLAALTVGSGERARGAISRLGLEGVASSIGQTDRVNDLYAAADVFVSSSRVEGQPFAVIEAILRGLPVVATDLPGHHDICDGLASCRVVGRDPARLAHAVGELLGRPAGERAAQATAARERTAARFDLRAWSEGIFERYQRSLEGAGGFSSVPEAPKES